MREMVGTFAHLEEIKKGTIDKWFCAMSSRERQ